MSYETEYQLVQCQPHYSYWIKEAAQKLDRRDPVDALHDAQLLLRLAELRCNRPAPETFRAKLIPSRPAQGGEL